MAQPVTRNGPSRTRSAILQIAIEVFAAEGYPGADVQVIADRAGVGKGTVYRHFGDKEKLFSATVRHSLEELSRSVERDAHLGRGAASYLRDVAVACARYYSAHPEYAELIIHERALFRGAVTPPHLLHRAEMRPGLVDELRRGIDSGELRSADVLATYEAFADLLFGSIVNGVLAGQSRALVPRVEYAVDLFLHGVVQDESVQRPGTAGTAPRPARDRKTRRSGVPQRRGE
jgi:AcrR family transcriptional regulator